jgi:glutamine amidotransferase
MITIVNYGMGNIGSIRNMCAYLGIEACVSDDPESIASADKLILPGVGAFDNAVKNLKSTGLWDALNVAVKKRGQPLLGICLGMQLLSRRSDEGILEGLGWIDAETVGFSFPSETGGFKIPHMGWNKINVYREGELFTDLQSSSKFYFVHSFHVRCAVESNILTTTHYGIEFVSSLNNGNVYGVQFHPEKSHRYGMKLLRNFATRT